MNLPNKLTILRIILVPIMVLIPYFGIPNALIIADIIFIIASITDKLDGTIARKNNQVTNFGKFLDPIADKILVLAAMIMLVEYGKIPGWIPIIIVFREFVVSGYRLIAAEQKGEVIAASIWGKIKTVTQMIAIIAMFLDKYSFGYFIGNTASMSVFEIVFNAFTTIMMIVCVISTIFSGYDYLKNGKDLLKDK